jgi:hypothetical protein
MTYAEAAALYAQLEARAVTRRARRPRRRPPFALAVCSTLAAAVIVAGVLSGRGGAHHASPPLHGPMILGPEPAPIGSNPFGAYGHRVTLARGARLLGSDVPTPHAALANPGNLSAVWGIHGEVILDYVSSQIRIRIVPANRILRSNARAAFRREARSDHLLPGALTIAGDPAIVVGGGPRKPGAAEVVRDGLDIAVMGSHSAAELIAIARSLTG